MARPRFRLEGTVLSTRDPQALASFYERLLGWVREADDGDWVVVRPLGGGAALSFHEDVEYVAPVWPSAAGQQLMMMHVDFVTNDLELAVEHALACGATLPAHQPNDEERVLLDPDGHPFCLVKYHDV